MGQPPCARNSAELMGLSYSFTGTAPGTRGSAKTTEIFTLRSTTRLCVRPGIRCVWNQLHRLFFGEGVVLSNTDIVRVTLLGAATSGLPSPLKSATVRVVAPWLSRLKNCGL